MTIRTATLDDLAEIVANDHQAVDERFATADLEPVTVKERSAWLHEHDAARLPIYVAEHNGAILGWRSLTAYPRRQRDST
jgi:L-amino acid N-acyltransferase YncA